MTRLPCEARKLGSSPAGTVGGQSGFKDMNRKSRNDPKPRKRRPASRDAADKALQDVIEQELERGEVNVGAEPDQKGEIKKPRKTD